MRVFRVVVYLGFLALACRKLHLPTDPTGCGTDEGMQGQVNGTVFTESGGPISDALITIAGRSSRTDGAGRFSLEAPPGPSTLEIEALGYVPPTGEITVIGTSTLRAVLPTTFASRILFGRVLDACSGRPIAGARVGLPNYFVTSSSDGTYVLAGVGGGTTLDFRVERDGYKTIGPGAFRLFWAATARDYLMERR
jgi:Carboxypeptidase regulatory-like domain